MATKKKNFYVNLLLDESGSMGSCFQATLTGYNSYVKQLTDSKNPTFFSLTKFNSNGCKPSFVAREVAKVPALSNKNYSPAGGTPLYDAIGKTIAAFDRKIARDKLKGNFLFVIQTDGNENASVEYDRATIFELIKQKTAKGWTFAFMGADMDAWKSASALGVNRQNTMSYASIDTVSAFKKLSDDSIRYSSNKARGASVDFFVQTGT